MVTVVRINCQSIFPWSQEGIEGRKIQKGRKSSSDRWTLTPTTVNIVVDVVFESSLIWWWCDFPLTLCDLSSHLWLERSERELSDFVKSERIKKKSEEHGLAHGEMSTLHCLQVNWKWGTRVSSRETRREEKTACCRAGRPVRERKDPPQNNEKQSHWAKALSFLFADLTCLLLSHTFPLRNFLIVGIKHFWCDFFQQLVNNSIMWEFNWLRTACCVIPSSITFTYLCGIFTPSLPYSHSFQFSPIEIPQH